VPYVVPDRVAVIERSRKSASAQIVYVLVGVLAYQAAASVLVHRIKLPFRSPLTMLVHSSLETVPSCRSYLTLLFYTPWRPYQGAVVRSLALPIHSSAKHSFLYVLRGVKPVSSHWHSEAFADCVRHHLTAVASSEAVPWSSGGWFRSFIL